LNFSGVPSHTFLGRALRSALRPLPAGMVVPIVQGRLRGKRWIVGSGVHGYWLGSYEWDKRRLFEDVLREGAVVLDVGANVGFYSLLASQIVGPTGRVFAFEPLPRNARYLHAHLRLNKIQNVTVLECAAWDASGTVQFQEAADASQGSVTPEGLLQVRALSLDDFAEECQVKSLDVLKMDIEGGEVRALRGAQGLLRGSSPVVFLATHGPGLHHDCLAILAEYGYCMRPMSATVSLYETSELVAWKA
jgi:FkbM family methyltransferase